MESRVSHFSGKAFDYLGSKQEGLNKGFLGNFGKNNHLGNYQGLENVNPNTGFSLPPSVLYS